jgi:hypothetical protein
LVFSRLEPIGRETRLAQGLGDTNTICGAIRFLFDEAEPLEKYIAVLWDKSGNVL